MPTKEEYAKYRPQILKWTRERRAKKYAPLHAELLQNVEEGISFANRTILLNDELRYAMVAAFIDGEGTITIHTQKDVSMANKVYMFPRISISNTDEMICLFVREAIGKGRVIQAEPAKERHKAVYRWFVDGMRNVMRVLPQVHPYLIAKREQSRLVMEYCQSRVSKKWSHEGYSKRELTILQEIRALNWKPHSPVVNPLQAFALSP